MKRTLITIVAAASVTILGFYFLASVILPGNEDVQLPSTFDSDKAGSVAESTPQSRANVLLQERRMQELVCLPIEAHVRDLIDSSQGCDVDSDCAIGHLGCPFGCVDTYNNNAETEILKEVKSYRGQCHSCEYVCPAPFGEFQAVCQNNKCQVIDRSKFHMQPYSSK